MTNVIMVLVVCSTVITSIVNVAKPAYKKFAGKYAISITTCLSFILGVISAFSLASYLDLDLNVGLTLMLGLALGTGSNIFYDIWELVKGLGVRLNEARKAIEEIEEKENSIGFKSEDVE